MVTRKDVLAVLTAAAIETDDALRPMEIAKRISRTWIVPRPIGARSVQGLLAALNETDLIEQVDLLVPYWYARNTCYRDRTVRAYRLSRKGLIAALLDEKREYTLMRTDRDAWHQKYYARVMNLDVQSA